MPQFNYAFMKQIFPFVDFKTAAWLCYSVHLHAYVIRTNKKMLSYTICHLLELYPQP